MPAALQGYSPGPPPIQHHNCTFSLLDHCFNFERVLFSGARSHVFFLIFVLLKKIFLNTQNTVYYITLYQHATQVFIKYKIIYEGQNVVAVSFHWPITLKYRMWLGLSFNHICVIITFNSWKLKAVSASSFQLCNIKDISDTHVCEPLIKTLGGALIRVFFLLPCDTDNLY